MKLNISLGLLASFQLVASFASQLIVLASLGAGRETDAFVGAQVVPAVAIAIFAVSLQNVWQPRLAVLSHDPVQWREAQAIAQGQVLLLFGGIALLLMATAGLWTRVVFPGFDEAQAALTAHLCQILLAATILNGHAALLTTAQRGRDRFLMAEFVSLVGTVAAAVAFAVALPRFGIEAAVWIMLMRACTVTAVLYVLADMPLISLRGAWRESSVWAQLRPMLAGSSIYKTGPLVDRFWSSYAPAGGITVFNLAQAGMTALAAVLDRALAVPTAPRLARLVAAGEYGRLRTVYRVCVFRVTLLIVIALVCLLLLRPLLNPIALLLKLTEPIASELWMLCLLLLGYAHVAACGGLVVAAFYAMDDMNTPVKVGVIGFLIGVLLKSLAFLAWGLPGLALGTSIYYMGNLLVMCVLLERKIDQQLS